MKAMGYVQRALPGCSCQAGAQFHPGFCRGGALGGVTVGEARRWKRWEKHYFLAWLSRSSVSRTAFSLALLLAVLGSLFVERSSVAHLLVRGSSGLDDTVPELDSFSEPAVAITVLRTDLENRFAVETETRGKAPLTTHGPLQELSGEIQDLNIDAHEELMRLYADGRRWNEFLNRYLIVLHEAPGRAEVGYWTRWALIYSATCGRTEEIVDALRHVIRFHPDPEAVKRLAGILERWETENDGMVAMPKSS